MCLGVPGRVVDRLAAHPDLATVLVGGVARPINVGLLEDEIGPGDWVLIHMGFALSRMTAAEAEESLAVLDALRTGE